jgi:hypothetical protein
MLEASFVRDRRDREVRGGNEGEQHYKTEEREREKQIDSDSTDKEDKARNGPRPLSDWQKDNIMECTYIDTLWKPWDELYAAPFAPPSSPNAVVV